MNTEEDIIKKGPTIACSNIVTCCTWLSKNSIYKMSKLRPDQRTLVAVDGTCHW